MKPVALEWKHPTDGLYLATTPIFLFSIADVAGFWRLTVQIPSHTLQHFPYPIGIERKKYKDLEKAKKAATTHWTRLATTLLQTMYEEDDDD